MCKLFKNTLNDTPFFRKLLVEGKNQGRLNTGVCVFGGLGSSTPPWLQVHPYTWCYPQAASEIALPPPLLHWPEDFVLLCGWGMSPHVSIRNEERFGGLEGTPHHHTTTSTSSHATVCCSSLSLLWKCWFSVVTQPPWSSLELSRAPGCLCESIFL